MRPQNKNLVHFKPGQSGNPAGRPKGARSKLAETFLEDLYDVWQEQGPEVIRKAADKNPLGFVQVVAKLLPRHVTVQADLGKNLQTFLQQMQQTPPSIEQKGHGDAP